MMAATDTN